MVNACTCVALSAANTAVDKAFTCAVVKELMVAALSDVRSEGVIAAISVVVQLATCVVAAGIEAKLVNE